MKPCEECNGDGVKAEAASYRQPPPGDAVWLKDYRPAVGSKVVRVGRVRPCIKCGGRGEVPGDADAA